MHIVDCLFELERKGAVIYWYYVRQNHGGPFRPSLSADAKNNNVGERGKKGSALEHGRGTV